MVPPFSHGGPNINEMYCLPYEVVKCKWVKMLSLLFLYNYINSVIYIKSSGLLVSAGTIFPLRCRVANEYAQVQVEPAPALSALNHVGREASWHPARTVDADSLGGSDCIPVLPSLLSVWGKETMYLL